MVRLLIFRGETPHAEIELPERTVRVGRSAQNEIVLEDPSKGVSRTHAEIRFENGRYVLVDNESQNGIWVAGSRVSSAVLEPGVVASVGPFRLMIEGPAASGGAPTADTPTDSTPLSERPTGPLVLEELLALPETPAPAPRVPDAPRPRQSYERPRTWLMAAAAALLIAALAFAAYTVMRQRRPAFDLAQARVMVNGGKCGQALAEHIDPALSANPGDPDALELKRRCTAPPPAPARVEPPPPPVPPVAEELDAADSLIAASACAEALDKVNAVLVTDANNERAKALAARATACLTPPSTPTSRSPADALAPRESPAAGGLDVLPRELDRDYQKRKLAMRRRYDEAVSMLQRQEHSQAAHEFEEIAQQVPNGYLELAQRRAEARDGMKEEAGKILHAAQAAERAGDFDAAADAYRRAHALDPGIQVDALLQRMDDQKLQRGRKRCEDGRLAFSYGENAAAAAAFQDVVKLLPPSDPCYTVARDRLRQLGK